MNPVDTPFGPVKIITPSGTLARFHEFEMSMEGLEVPSMSSRARHHSSSPAHARNSAVLDVFKERPDIVGFWFVDDDHMYNPDTLLKLMRHDLPVVCSLTLLARPPFFPILFQHKVWNEQEKRPQWTNIPWQTLDRQRGLIPVYAAAGAGIYVKREILEKTIPWPWFAIGQYVPDECQEDMWFYERCHEYNIPIFADLDTRLGHTAPCTAVPWQDLDGRWWVKLYWGDHDFIVLPRSDLPGVKPKLAYTEEELLPGMLDKAVR